MLLAMLSVLLISVLFVDGHITEAAEKLELFLKGDGATRMPNVQCTPDWNCSAWSECSYLEVQTRNCTDTNNCNTDKDRPSGSRPCVLPVIGHLNVNPCTGRTISLWTIPESFDAPDYFVGFLPDCQNISVEVLYRKCFNEDIEIDLVRYGNTQGWVKRKVLLCPAEYNKSGCLYAPDTICEYEKKRDCPILTIDEVYGVCGECLNESQCEHHPNKTVCLDNKCVECVKNSDCAADKSVCFKNACVECVESSDCPDSRPACILSEEGYACVECAENSDCTDPERSTCNKEEHRCIGCLVDSDCKDPTPYCNSPQNKCVECRENSECETGYMCTSEYHKQYPNTCVSMWR